MSSRLEMLIEAFGAMPISSALLRDIGLDSLQSASDGDVGSATLRAVGQESRCPVSISMPIPHEAKALQEELARAIYIMEGCALLKGEPPASEARELRNLRAKLYRVAHGRDYALTEFTTMIIHGKSVQEMGFSELEKWIRQFEKGELRSHENGWK